MTISTQGGGVSRSRAKAIQYHNNNQVVIEQKVIEYGDSLQIIAVPVTDLGVAPQYYYQSEPLRGRNLSEADRKAIIEEVVAGVLAGIDARFDVVGDDGKPVVPNPGGGTVEPPKETPAPASDLEKQVLAIFTNNCATCHTAGGLDVEGIPTLLASDGTIKKLADSNLEQLKRFKVWESTFFGHMPKNSSPLNESDVEILHKWIKAK
jgi:mono/diheme cytochrome c family protein